MIISTKEMNMTTYEWNDPILREGNLTKPVYVHQRNSYSDLGDHYTAIPMHMLDDLRRTLKQNGFKLTTYYVGHRPPDHALDNYYASKGSKRKWSVVYGTTRKENARYAKIVITDKKTGERRYL
jgi:hypothetical protein